MNCPWLVVPLPWVPRIVQSYRIGTTIRVTSLSGYSSQAMTTSPLATESGFDIGTQLGIDTDGRRDPQDAARNVAIRNGNTRLALIWLLETSTPRVTRGEEWRDSTRRDNAD